jgi:Mce-associated membrane protein
VSAPSLPRRRVNQSEERAVPTLLNRALARAAAVPAALSARWSEALGFAVAQPSRAVRRLWPAAVALAVLAGALGYGAHYYAQVEQARTGAIVAAKDAVVPLLSYDYRTIDRQVATTRDLVTGQFADDYAALVRNKIIGTARAQAVSIQTQVASASIESGSPSRVVVFLFVNQQSQVAGASDPALTGSRLLMTMQLVDGRWRVADLRPV